MSDAPQAGNGRAQGSPATGDPATGGPATGGLATGGLATGGHMDGRPAPRIMAAAPIVPVRDVQASVAFYVAMLGFETVFVAADGATGEVGRDGARIMFVACDDADTLAVTATNMSIYLQVNDVDTLWNDLSPRLGDLPRNRVRAPFDQAYGMREFHVKDPDGFLMFFGQPAG